MLEKDNGTRYATGEPWSTGCESVKNCDRTPKGTPNVCLPSEVYDKMTALLKEFKDREWLGYLIGHDLEVQDIIIPRQEVTFASVVVTDTEIPPNVIGTVHSHHSMGAFLSATDDKYLASNHPVTLVISNSSMAAAVRVELPCGAHKAIKADFTVVLPDEAGIAEFIEQSKLLIVNKITTYAKITPKNTIPKSASNPLGYAPCDLCGELEHIKDLTGTEGLELCPACHRCFFPSGSFANGFSF